MMVGGAVTGAMIMASGVTLQAPHGGIFVFFAIDNLLWFLVALARRHGRRRRRRGRRQAVHRQVRAELESATLATA